MKYSLVCLLVLLSAHAGLCADNPTVKLELLVDGSITNPATGTVSGYMSQPEHFEVQLEEKPLGNLIGVKHYWLGSLTKEAQVGHNPVTVKLLVSKMEATDGKVHFWGQVSFGNKISAAVGGENLANLRLMGMGAPQDLPNNCVLEPRAIIDFK
jgi:hypothetical protein